MYYEAEERAERIGWVPIILMFLAAILACAILIPLAKRNHPTTQEKPRS